MSDECVVGVCESIRETEHAIHRLRKADFPTSQISVVVRRSGGGAEEIDADTINEDEVYDTAVGAGLGGVLGFLGGVAVASITGLGTFFLIGPIGGLSAGVALGALAGWGVHEELLQHYGRHVKQGKILVIAHGNRREVDQASRILQQAGACEVRIHASGTSDPP